MKLDLTPEGEWDPLLGGAIFLWIVAGLGYWRVSRTADWPEAQGLITGHDVEIDDMKIDSGLSIYRTPYTQYRFEAGGKVHKGNRMACAPVVTQSFAVAQAARAAWRPGRKVRVAYNPADPEENCLRRPLPGEYQVALAVSALGLLLSLVPMGLKALRWYRGVMPVAVVVLCIAATCAGFAFIFGLPGQHLFGYKWLNEPIERIRHFDVIEEAAQAQAAATR